MHPRPEKGFVRHVLVAIVLLALAAMIWVTTEAIVIAFGGIVLATVLLSLSMPLTRLTGLAPRWSLLVVVLGLTAIFGLFTWLFGSEVAHQFAELKIRLPSAVGKLRDWLNVSPVGRIVIESLNQSGANKEAFTQASAMLAATFGAVGNLLLILFLGLYFAIDPTLYRDGLLRLIPVPRRPQVKRALNDSGEALRKWLLAQVIAMIAVGVLTGTALGILGVPLALSLGVLAALFEFVPVIGPIVSAVPGILLAFTKGPEAAIYVALAYIAVQQIESNVITPLVQRWAVKLPPVLGLLAIVFCGLLFGALGVIFAMPIAVVVMVLVKDLYVEDTLEGTRQVRAPREKRLTSAVAK